VIDRNVGATLGLGAIVLAFYSLIPQSASVPPPTIPTASNPKAEDSYLAPLFVLDDFLGQDANGKARTVDSVEAGPYKVQFVVATLPDPVDSHFASLFDRGLEAMVSAMVDSGYDLDRWSLPWRIPAPTEVEAVWATNSSGKPTLNARPPMLDAHRSHPGAVLFRKKRELVVLFLIGETPTHGLQKDAFVQSLNAISEFEKANAASLLDAGLPLPILAPYFSGSSESLHIVLNSQVLLRGVHVMSGSATADTNSSTLSLKGKSWYETVTHTDGAMLQALHRYFKSIGVYPAAHVALLVEDGTAFGQDFARKFASPVASPNSQGSALPDLKLIMRFPLQISQIRSAYEKRESSRRATLAGPPVQRALEISLEGPERPKDALSPFEPRMTANAADLVLANVFDTVRRQRIRYLGLVASDTRDVLFLARKAREYGTDAQLFTFGADVLYQHPELQPSLDGLLVVTTYPLLAADQAWHATGSHRRTFPGSSEEGIYNALLFLMRQGNRAVDYAPIEVAGPTQSHLPPIWIVVNGRHGFWPVWLLPASAVNGGTPLLPDAGVPDASDIHSLPRLPIPAAVLVLFTAWSIAAFVFAFGYHHYRPAASNGDQSSASSGQSRGAGMARDRLRVFFCRCHDESHVFMNHAAMAGLAFVLAVIQGFLATQLALWELIARRDGPIQVLAGLILASAFVLTFFTARISLLEVHQLFGARRLIKIGTDTSSPERSITQVGRAFAFNLAMLLPFAAIGIAVAAVTFSAADAEAGQNFLLQEFLFLNRSFALLSRSGPLLPLCLGSVVLALFAVCQVRRSLLYEEQRIQPPKDDPPQSLLALLEPYSTFTLIIRNPSTSILACILPLGGLLMFQLLFVRDGWYRSFDGRCWGVLLNLLLLLCGWCVAWSVLEFRAIWLRLSALLRILAWSPLADAFNRMPDGLARSQWRMWRTAPTLTSLHVAVSHLKTLVNLGKRIQGLDGQLLLSKEVQTAQMNADGMFTAVLRGAHEGYASTQLDRKSLRTELALATMGVCRMLERAWILWPSRAEIADKSDKEQEALNTIVWLRRQVPSPPDVYIRIAEEYVAVRFVSFIHYAFSHMRNVLTFALAGFVLLMALIGSYPFQPRHPVIGLAWIVGLIGIAGVVWTFVDMDRDLILSYIAKTSPGRINFNLEFATNLLVYGLVPLLTLLATQFPELGDWILSMLNPAMRIR